MKETQETRTQNLLTSELNSEWRFGFKNITDNNVIHC